MSDELTPEELQDAADEAEAAQWLRDNGYARLVSPSSIEVLDTVPPPGLGRWNWICPGTAFEFPNCAAIEWELLGAELRVVDREVRGLTNDEDIAYTAGLREARGRLN